MKTVVWLTTIISKDLFVYFSRYSRSSKFSFNEQRYYKKDWVFACNFSACILSISKYLEFRIYFDSKFCSEEELLNWLNKRDSFGRGDKWIEMLLFERFSGSFMLYKEDEKPVFVKNPKGKIELQQ